MENEDKYFRVRYVANDGDIRWTVVKAKDESDAESVAWDETTWSDGGINKIIDVEHSTKREYEE